MPDSKPTSVIGILQIVTMLVGIATLLFAFGSKTEQLNQNRTDIEKLAVAVNDLARAQASSAVVDAMHNKTLEDIQRRLENLERSGK